MIWLSLFCLYPASLWSQGRPEVVWRVAGHTAKINTIELSPDGRTLATAGDDGCARLWGAEDGELRFSLTNAGNNPVLRATFSPNGEWLATGTHPDLPSPCATKLWRVRDGQPIWSLNQRCRGLVFSPDSQSLMVSAYKRYYFNSVVILRASDGTEVKSLEPDIIGYSWLALSPDGSELAAPIFGAANTKFFRMDDGNVSRIIDTSTEDFTTYSPTGRQLVMCRNWAGGFKAVNAANGIYEMTFWGHSGPQNWVAFTRDGRLMLSSNADSIRFWRVADGMQLLKLDQDLHQPTTLVVGADNRYFAYGGADGTITVARMPTLITEMSRTNGQAVLHWVGSTARYQVQQITNLAAGLWHNVGTPTTNTTLAVPTPAAGGFFRVQGIKE